ncbi:uncharacterized protein MELLADRAFT_112748 [Melampsora larici-populina 98AG31]|uniref:Uncharacterized protein n=1 Tax=Melampsora larici-populina (strain 98AG31 / pathotype 3-4-7) TaxID=747676 RepID=F4S7G6_MELLP|nr:uncharacterized protein MELLADRAFT_112748 [Melampsora larici-populina 98AG31]EGF99405.1 hypothetical protein MELLADRAFT_112748 [Melampsora larici-populina 98AG31]
MVLSAKSQSKLSHNITKLLQTFSRLISSPPPKYSPRMVSSPSPSASQDRSASRSTTPSSPPGYPLQSYEIRRHDANSAILLDPSPTANEARFAVRIHSDSIYLYRPAKETALFGEPVMEACIKGLIHKREAKLDDWREKKASQKGKYRLRHRHGMHIYTNGEDDSKAWREDTSGCLHLTKNNSPTRDTLACLNIPQVIPSGLDKLHNLNGSIDFLDESVTHGVEEELAILTCITTHVINRRASKN